CDRRRFLDAHHITHWAHGGDTSLDNLIHLCGHHHRLVHEGGYRVDRSPSGALVFRRPDGQRIAAAPRPPRGDHHALTRRPGASRLTPDSCRPRWGGERLDLPYVVDVVLDMTAGVPGGPGG